MRNSDPDNQGCIVTLAFSPSRPWARFRSGLDKPLTACAALLQLRRDSRRRATANSSTIPILIPIGSAPANRAEIERLCRRGEFAQALAFAWTVLEVDPLDRTTRIHELLMRIVVDGPDGCEMEIENLRTYSELSNQEKHLVRKIFLVCHDVAERQQDSGKMWSYQRLLRRLMLNQSLDTQIPQSEDIADAGRTVTALKNIAAQASFFWTESTEGLRNKIFDYMDTRSGSRPGPLVFSLVLIAGSVAAYTMGGSFSQRSIEKLQPAAISPPAPVSFPGEIDVSISEFRAKAGNVQLDNASTAELRKFIHGKLLALNALYIARSVEVSGLAGDMTVELTIDESGNVTRLYESGASLSDFGFKQTILDEMRKWRFPELNGEQLSITIVYGFADKAALAPLPKPGATAEELSPAAK